MSGASDYATEAFAYLRVNNAPHDDRLWAPAGGSLAMMVVERRRLGSGGVLLADPCRVAGDHLAQFGQAGAAESPAAALFLQ
jgi:hypothetical protein